MTHTQTVSSREIVSAPVQSWPLLFAYRDRLYGKGYVVEISIRGRALAVTYQDGQVWMYGVNPGVSPSTEPISRQRIWRSGAVLRPC
jgi:hypothetical protein